MNALEKAIYEACQQAIKAGWSVNGIAKGAGVDQPALSRFLRQEASKLTGKHRSMTSETAAALAAFFGMKLTAPRIPAVPKN